MDTETPVSHPASCLQVEHLKTFQGHRGAVHGVASQEAVPEFLSVSEDCSLRRWKLMAGNSVRLLGTF